MGNRTWVPEKSCSPGTTGRTKCHADELFLVIRDEVDLRRLGDGLNGDFDQNAPPLLRALLPGWGLDTVFVTRPA